MWSFYIYVLLVFFFKQKTAYEMRMSDWSSDVCSSDLDQNKVDRHLLFICDVFAGLQAGRGVGGRRRVRLGERGRRDGQQGHQQQHEPYAEIGRESCREREGKYV